MAEEDDEGSLVSRLANRSAPGLHRMSTPGGGEVYKGELARQALRAVGARAFTMDNTIFVDDDFDLNKPEDQALYAHETHHLMGSGGAADMAHDKHDSEEAAAQAVERMVLHRSMKGHDFGEIMRDVRSGEGVQMAMRSLTSDPNATGAPGGSEPGEDPIAAYAAMLAQGKSHEQVIMELRNFVLMALQDLETETLFRTGGSNFL